MNRKDVVERATQIFRDVLDEDSIVLRDSLTAKDIDGWDSLSHISLIVAIEREFHIKFQLAELKHLKDVGALLDLVVKKIA